MHAHESRRPHPSMWPSPTTPQSSRANRDQRGLLTRLLIAMLLTAIVVGLCRHWLTSPAPGTESAAQEIGALFGSLAVFVVGGLPAAITVWLATRLRPEAGVGRILALTALCCAASAIPGGIVLRLLIWETSGWLATLAAPTALGYIAFAAVVLTAHGGHAAAGRAR